LEDITLARLFTESSPHVPAPEAFRKKPILTQFAFARLLEWLDNGVDSHGEQYLEMRRRLVTYFDRRNRSDADELADETFNRIARTLEQTGFIATTPPARYCYVVARWRVDRGGVPGHALIAESSLMTGAGCSTDDRRLATEPVVRAQAGGSGGQASPRNPPPPQYFTSWS
jgi:hypothetical protein